MDRSDHAFQDDVDAGFLPRLPQGGVGEGFPGLDSARRKVPGLPMLRSWMSRNLSPRRAITTTKVHVGIGALTM
ncbi:hypothetical protein ABLE92_14125 [Gordonia sp. VNQ95]|uniref:hypothetical protein n=1 Tax=Gordonia TaxID=2053 RepID=UPI0032B47316